MVDCTTSSSVNANKIASKIKSEIVNDPKLPFSKLLTAEEIKQKMQVIESKPKDEVKQIKPRDRIFTTAMTLWTFLSQVMDTDQSQQAAVARVIANSIANGQDAPSANTSAYSQARSRLSEELLITLTQDTAIGLADSVPDERGWKDRKVKLVDGSTVSMPDTPDNQSEYPQPSTQKEGIGFPIARIVAIIDYFSGAVMNLAIGSYSGKETGEHALLRQIISSVNPNEVLLGDRYYPSYFLMAMLISLKIDGVFPMHRSRKYDFSKGKSLGNKDHIVTWHKPAKPEWMSQEEYDSMPQEITVREVEIRNECPGFRTTKRTLVTTFLDEKAVSKTALAKLYDYRWFVEISLRDIKSTMQMDILRGKTPSMVRKEIWAHLLAYNLIRKIMLQAAILHKKPITELSFKLALQVINAFEQAGLLNSSNHNVYLKLLDTIAYKKVGNRPGRQEPRCIKRRPKAFPRLQKSRKMYRETA
jgi:hypothetical protein